MNEHIVHIDNIEELIISKYIIEEELIKQKQLEKKYTLQEFIQDFLKMNDHIAVYNIVKKPEIIPYYIYKLNNDVFIFFAEQSDMVNKLYNFLKSIDFDESNLKPYAGGPNMLRINYSEYELH